MNQTAFAEYLWIDGGHPTQQIRSKARIVSVPERPRPWDFPEWSFDGSATGQARIEESDCMLQPVRIYPDPLRPGGNYLVLCEVHTADGRPHPSNQRVHLRELLDVVAATEDPWLGFEQEYTLFSANQPLGLPDTASPAGQGRYYCAAGARLVRGRDFVEAHAQACVDAGLLFYGINADVMPGQWEFQIGYRGIHGDRADALCASDDLWVGRYLLHRYGERFGLDVSLDPKPVDGDWNGAGLHTDFSTTSTRDPRIGLAALRRIIDDLALRHDEHIRQFGDGLDARLTGLHQTSHIATFRSGIANRRASIRIPHAVVESGCGFLEDRRPGANADPYRVACCLIGVVAGRHTGTRRDHDAA